MAAVGTPPVAKQWLNIVDGYEAEVFQGRSRTALERILRQSVPTRPWFDGTAKTIQAARIVQAIPFGETSHGQQTFFVFLRIEYVEGEPEVYLLVLGFAWGAEATGWLEQTPQGVVARLGANPITTRACSSTPRSIKASNVSCSMPCSAAAVPARRTANWSRSRHRF